MTLQDILSKEPVFPEDSTILFTKGKDMNSSNPLRVLIFNERIEINPDLFYSYPAEFQYYLLKWGYHRCKVKDIYEADGLALNDYLKKGLSKNLFMKTFSKFIEGNITKENIKRTNVNFYTLFIGTPRERKFKFVDKQTGKIIVPKGYYLNSEGEVFVNESDIDYDTGFYKTDTVFPIEYTGFDDPETNQEIFEGDIRGYKNDSSVYVVVWKYNSWRIKYADSKDEEIYPELNWLNLEHTEHLGNIFENPENFKPRKPN
jgi:hypothetical protein